MNIPICTQGKGEAARSWHNRSKSCFEVKTAATFREDHHSPKESDSKKNGRKMLEKGEIMEIKSAQTGSSLVVNIDDVSDKTAILETIQGCADGSCACSTDEYQKVASMEITPGSNSIQLNIEVKPGEIIDPNCISECLAPADK